MKQLNKVLSLLLSTVMLMALMCGIFVTPASAATSNLDKIQEYEIKVDIRQDGTMDIRYSITWEVLSDKNGSEPLTWVNVGIPNEHVDQIQALTDNINTIRYSHSNGGDYVRIDFTEKHYKGDVFTFEFAIHQSYMYLLDHHNVVRYSFTPGWFEDIEIDIMKIEWVRTDNIIENDSNEQSNDYYIWSYADLPEGKRITANVKYDSAGFYVDENQQYQEKSSDMSAFAVVLIVIAVVLVILFILALIADDGYGGGSGGVFISSGCAHSSCACAGCASCACACACAGGGRAGCSTKDFYSNKSVVVDVDTFNKAAETVKKSI